MAKKTNTLDGLKDIFKSVDDLNPDAAILEASTLSTADEWIDTGSYALNAIISGSMYKGIPVGRISGFSGPSMAGKTLIMNKIMANAQKEGFIAVIWDSEVAVDKKGAEAIGMDASRTKYYPVETIEDCRNQICAFLDNVIKADNPELKFIISIDSLGNLASAKEIRDTASNKDASDVGQRAKAIKSMMRVLTYKAAKARVPILFSNHVYDSMEMFPTLVKTQSGGKGPIYLASVLVQPSTKNNISGVTLGALTIKNRFVPNYLKTELYLNFKTGLDKHTGLFEIAEAFGVIEKPGRTVMFNGESLGYRKDLEKNVEFWGKVMPKLEEVLQEKLCYGGGDTSVDIKEEVDNIV
jgi:recombination protein RecA